MTDYDLTDDSQIKQYLENIETEYSYQCLSEREPDGCHRLADFMDSVKGNHELGAKLFKQNCDELCYAHSCFKFAGKRMLGKGVEKDHADAMKYYESACKYGFPRGCSVAGMVYLEGQGIEKNIEKGVQYLSEACRQDRGESCAVLGTGYLLGRDNISKDIEKAKLLLGKGCELGSLQACINLSRMHKMGDGVPKNTSLAEKYKMMAVKIKQSKDGTDQPGVRLGRMQ